jgi:hypothetical protein
MQLTIIGSFFLPVIVKSFEPGPTPAPPSRKKSKTVRHAKPPEKPSGDLNLNLNSGFFYAFDSAQWIPSRATLSGLSTLENVRMAGAGGLAGSTASGRFRGSLAAMPSTLIAGTARFKALSLWTRNGTTNGFWAGCRFA